MVHDDFYFKVPVNCDRLIQMLNSTLASPGGSSVSRVMLSLGSIVGFEDTFWTGFPE